MKNFAITGVSGYIAPRHLRAIRDTGNRLIAAVDPNDSAGILDSYFTDVAFFTEFERFDRHIEKLRHRSQGESLDYLSICSPNHLHDAHCRLALRVGADAICEKPLVLNPWNLDALEEIERESGKRIWTILQLRLLPSIIELKQKIDAAPPGTRHHVKLSYITGRGPWYRYSWKGQHEKSGGIATNIGIHLFDLLLWLFGPVQKNEVHVMERERAGGFLALERAEIVWFLSIDMKDLPFEPRPGELTTFRSILVDGQELEFTKGFTDLHTRVYEETLAGRGFGIADARRSIELVHQIRHAPIGRGEGPRHPSLR